MERKFVKVFVSMFLSFLLMFLPLSGSFAKASEDEDQNNIDLMTKTGMTVGSTSEWWSLGIGDDDYTFTLREPKEVLLWMISLKNPPIPGWDAEGKYLAETEFRMANGENILEGGFGVHTYEFVKDFLKSKIEVLKLNSSDMKKVAALKRIIDGVATTNDIKEWIEFYKVYPQLNIDFSRNISNVLAISVTSNYPNGKWVDGDFYNGNDKLMSSGVDAFHIYGSAKLKKINNVQPKTNQEDFQRLILDISNVLKGKKTETKYGSYATELVKEYKKVNDTYQVLGKNTIKTFNNLNEATKFAKELNKKDSSIATVVYNRKTNLLEWTNFPFKVTQNGTKYLKIFANSNEAISYAKKYNEAMVENLLTKKIVWHNRMTYIITFTYNKKTSTVSESFYKDSTIFKAKTYNLLNMAKKIIGFNDKEKVKIKVLNSKTNEVVWKN